MIEEKHRGNVQRKVGMPGPQVGFQTYRGTLLTLVNLK
jgi:hypothetical protein